MVILQCINIKDAYTPIRIAGRSSLIQYHFRIGYLSYLWQTVVVRGLSHYPFTTRTVRKQEDEIAVATRVGGDAHLYIERAYYIQQARPIQVETERNQPEPGHTQPYHPIDHQNHPKQPKTTIYRGIYRFSLTYQGILVLRRTIYRFLS